MKIEKYVVLPNKDASLGVVDTIYDTIDEARNKSEPGNAIVALVFELVDSELVEET